MAFLTKAYPHLCSKIDLEGVQPRLKSVHYAQILFTDYAQISYFVHFLRL